MRKNRLFEIAGAMLFSAAAVPHLRYPSWDISFQGARPCPPWAQVGVPAAAAVRLVPSVGGASLPSVSALPRCTRLAVQARLSVCMLLEADSQG